MRAHEDCSQARLLHAQHLVTAARTNLDGLGAGTFEAEDMFAGNHAAVDKYGLVALVAAVYHRIKDFLANQTDFMVPLQAQHRLGRPTRQCGERRCL